MAEKIVLEGFMVDNRFRIGHYNADRSKVKLVSDGHVVNEKSARLVWKRGTYGDDTLGFSRDVETIWPLKKRGLFRKEISGSTYSLTDYTAEKVMDGTSSYGNYYKRCTFQYNGVQMGSHHFCWMAEKLFGIQHVFNLNNDLDMMAYDKLLTDQATLNKIIEAEQYIIRSFENSQNYKDAMANQAVVDKNKTRVNF